MKKINTHLLSTRSVLIFHLAAQSGNFTRAAKALNVGQPAISHGVRQLEERLGVSLFERRPQGVVLTEAGERLARHLERGFGDIQLGLEEAMASQQPNKLTLVVSTSLASHWLMPRIAQFKHRYPDAQLHCITQDTDQMIGRDEFDLCIPLGSGPFPGYQRWKLADESLLAVCSPEFARRQSVELSDPRSLCQLPLIHLEERYVSRFNWQAYFDHFQLDRSSLRGDETYNDYSIVVQAAMEGQGVALGWSHIVSPLIEQGKLVAIGGQAISTEQPFYIISPEQRQLSQEAQALRDWLLLEMANTTADSAY